MSSIDGYKVNPCCFYLLTCSSHGFTFSKNNKRLVWKRQESNLLIYAYLNQTRILKKPSSNTSCHADLNQFPLWAFPPKIAATRATSKGNIVIIGNVLLERLLALDCAESLVTLLALPFRELLRRASSGLRDI